MANLLDRLRLALRIVSGGMSDSQVLGLLFPNLRGTPPARGIADLLRAYAEMPWFHVALDKVAWSVSSVRWRVLAIKRKGEPKYLRPRGLQRAAYAERRRMLHQYELDGEVEEFHDHPLLTLLHDANPYFTGGTHRWLTQVYLDAIGECGWLKERNGAGAPVAIWPVPPHWVRELPTPKRPFFLVAVDREAVPIPMTEMLWFSRPHPLNPFGRGTGIGFALGDELETDEYAARHTKQWFFNSARPDLLVTIEGADKAEIQRVEQHWLQRHQGFWRAFKPFFSNQKMDAKEISHTFREMQLTELRAFERDTIVQVFGVPPEVLGIVESSNRATIDAADFMMGKHVTIPRLEFLREVMQERLVPEYDERILLDYQSPLEEDREFALKALTAMPKTATVDEWRHLQGLPPLDDERGQVFLTDLTTFASLEPGGGVTERPAPAGGNGDGEEDGKYLPAHAHPAAVLEAEDLGEALHVLAAGLELEELGAPTTVVVPSDVPVRDLVGVKLEAEDFYATVHRIADKLAPRWRKAFLEIMRRVGGRVSLAALEDALRSGNIEAAARLLPAEVVRQALGSESRLPALLRATVAAAGNAAAAELAESLGISISFAELNPHAVAFIQRATGQLITEVTQETILAVRHIIERSFREAIAPRDAARLIRDVIGLHSRQAQAVGNFRQRLQDQGLEAETIASRVGRYAEAQLRYRALMIARTETIQAANMGQQLLWQQASREGLLPKDRVRRVWLVTPDDRLDTRVCEPMPHIAANKDVGLDDLFTTGTGEKVLVPPAHPNCRCAVALRVLR